MHSALPETKADRLVLHVGNNRFPDGRITVRLKAPADAEIDVELDPDGASSCAVEKCLSAGEWTVSVAIVSPEELRDAQRHPEKYENLQVRVCGWNVRWNDMPKKEQDEYILRAERIMR